MKINSKRKLRLNRETVRTLEDDSLQRANGGDISIVTRIFSCLASYCGSCTC